jgi:hypothetical protein
MFQADPLIYTLLSFHTRSRPTTSASAARHQPDRQPSKRMPNFGSWAGRLHAVLARDLLESHLFQNCI